MPSQHSWTQAAPRNPKRKVGAGFSPSSTPIRADLQQGTPRGPKSPRHPTPETGCESSSAARSSTPPSSHIHTIAHTSLRPASPPALSKRGPVQPCPIPAPSVNLQILSAQPDHAIDTPTGSPPKRAALQRTHVVWMFIGDTPSIIRTSPTPPPSSHPARRTIRRPSSTHGHNALELPERQSSPLARHPSACGIESEQDNESNSHSEEKGDDGRDSWTSGLIAERYNASADIPESTGPAVVARSLPQPEAEFEGSGREYLSWEQQRKLSGDSPNASPSLLRNHAHQRTLADYDQTNARIRALNAGLLADTRVRPRSHPYQRHLELSTATSRILRPDRGVGVRYLNVPGAATDALVAARRRASRRRTSAAGTGIVDISDSESSQFESDDDDHDDHDNNNDNDNECESSPLGPESVAFEAETLPEARSDAPAFLRKPPAASTATTPAKPQDYVSAAARRAITSSPPPTDAPGLQWPQFRPVHDRPAAHHRLQPAHLPALLANDAPTSSTLLTTPDPKGKKRARDPDVDGGSWLDSARAESLVREGKRRRAAPGTSVSGTPPSSRTASTTDPTRRNRFDTSATRCRD